MSRHVIEIYEEVYLAYGIDHALGYWYDITDEAIEDVDNQIIEEESTVLTNISNSDFAAKLKSFGVSEDVITNIHLDLPI